MRDDAELLRRYAGNRDEGAFAELVRRHLGLVYHAALRQCGGDAHRAEDVAQAVFTDLARKAGKLASRPVLAGWLYTSTRYAAAQAVRGEARRQAREQEAHAMNEILSDHRAEPVAEWEKLRPVIDDALHALGERDREAVLLRFFEGRPFADIGAKLSVSEDAARMRVERALEKLRTRLAQRGVRSTTAALGLAFANQAGAAVPAGLAATVTGAALSGVAQAGGVATVIFMGMTKSQLGIAAVLAVVGTTGLIVQTQTIAAQRHELAAVRAENQATAALRADNARLASSAAEVDALRGQVAGSARLREESQMLKQAMQSSLQPGAATAASGTAGAGVMTPNVFELSMVDHVPRVRFQTTPTYPLSLRTQGVSGEVNVDFLVDAEGDVRKAAPVRSSHPGFESFAVDAVARWKFAPGRKAGVAVATHLQMTIYFDAVSGNVTWSNPGFATVPRNPVGKK